jgi:hypothetical protein
MFVTIGVSDTAGRDQRQIPDQISPRTKFA